MPREWWGGWWSAFAARWPDYGIEGALLGAFMISACASVAIVESSRSPVRRRVRSALGRRAIIGLAMGLTAVGLIYSPWGRRSGAHMNPAVTLAFLSMGKIGSAHAAGYVLGQVMGGAVGVLLARAVLGRVVESDEVRWVVTEPGRWGARPAIIAEFVMSFVLLSGVLAFAREPGLIRWTGTLAGALVAAYITLEAPISGMSINPARTFASAVWARSYRGWWVYALAPVAGMLAAAMLFARLEPGHCCPTLNHAPGKCAGAMSAGR